MALENKTIVVTGANRGLGFEWVKQLVQRPGNTIIAGVRDPTKAQNLVDLGGNVLVRQLDVSNPASVEAWAESLKESDIHIDVVINNAGVFTSKPIDEVDSEDFIAMITTNTIGPFLVVQSLHRRGLIGGQRGPTLVATISSTLGSQGESNPTGLMATVGVKPGGYHAYRASKAAVNSVVKALSYDLASEGITSTAICPGFVNTDMTNHNAAIDTETSVKGQINVLETEKDLQGTFHYYDGTTIKW